eukprot:422603-Rhodomonas_salina.1
MSVDDNKDVISIPSDSENDAMPPSPKVPSFEDSDSHASDFMDIDSFPKTHSVVVKSPIRKKRKIAKGGKRNKTAPPKGKRK